MLATTDNPSEADSCLNPATTSFQLLSPSTLHAEQLSTMLSQRPPLFRYGAEAMPWMLSPPQLAQFAGMSQQQLKGKDILRTVLTSRGVTYESEPKRSRPQVSVEELEKRQLRRERNKLAAAKCRQKRRVHAQTVQQQHEILVKTNEELVQTIRNLENEVKELQAMLNGHACVLSDEGRKRIEKEIEDEVTSAGVSANNGRNNDEDDEDDETRETETRSVDENSVDSSSEN